jgi:hypothetical protein
MAQTQFADVDYLWNLGQGRRSNQNNPLRMPFLEHAMGKLAANSVISTPEAAAKVFCYVEEEGSCFYVNDHLSDDETVAKMGHPNLLWVRPARPASRLTTRETLVGHPGHPPIVTLY